jgi:hypothetical protein
VRVIGGDRPEPHQSAGRGSGQGQLGPPGTSASHAAA